MSREQTEGGTNGDDFQVEGYYYFTVMQGGIQCASETAFVAINALFQG